MSVSACIGVKRASSEECACSVHMFLAFLLHPRVTPCYRSLTHPVTIAIAVGGVLALCLSKERSATELAIVFVLER